MSLLAVHTTVIPPLPTAGHGPGDLSLWISAPLLVALIAFAAWTRRR